MKKTAAKGLFIEFTANIEFCSALTRRLAETEYGFSSKFSHEN